MDRKHAMRTTHPADIIQPGENSTASPTAIERCSSSLGNHASIVSISNDDLKLATALYRRFALQSTARWLLPTWRIWRCLRVPHDELVDIFHNPEFKSASYGGLETCGSVHVCAICGGKIMGRRA